MGLIFATDIVLIISLYLLAAYGIIVLRWLNKTLNEEESEDEE